MRVAFPTILLLLGSLTVFSQASDFITVKKRNNRTLASYFPGTMIACRTIYQNDISGVVYAVRNDSVFIQQYNIQAVPNMWGVAKIDTLGSNITGIPYKDIETVMLRRRESFTFIRNGTLFMVGGLGYALLNLINGQYLNESITGSKNRKSLGIALGVAGAGFVMNRIYRYNIRHHRRYRIEYIHMQGPSKLRGF